MQDSIIEEIRHYRDEYAKRFNYDLQAIYHDLKEKQEKSGRKIVSFSPKPAKSLVDKSMLNKTKRYACTAY
jgi:hypothetical protein